MIKLTVKQIQDVPYTSFEQLFDEDNIIRVRASGQDTIFLHVPENKTYIVDETFAQVQALLGVASASGSFSKEIWGLFDATGGKAIGAYNLVDPVTGVDIVLPPNAIVTDGFYVTETTFTSATDAATIALAVASGAAGGIKAAIAISNGANPWDAGTTAIVPVGTVATFLAATTAQRNVTATVAVENLTAGKLRLCLKYSVRP
jgi:hypothetical protein